MQRSTIDYGIDLGTTNSSVAVLVGTVTEVVPSKDGSTVTPSAVWIDRRGHLHVGREARARAMDDEENADIEFKRRMGMEAPKTFQRAGRPMTPEELSAEVLKSLKGDVMVSRGEDLRSAVITVPAAFEQPQCQATQRAAKLAGLELCPLLQEPVAAALAYGFQALDAKAHWLVYDFGGGTFDAAVVALQEGAIRVVNHAGDNFLGGKNLDWEIVERLLVPPLVKDRSLAAFTRANPRWRAALAKLKHHAEEAKIQVSRTGRSQEIWIEALCADDRGDVVDFQFELTPGALEALVQPLAEQSIQLCRQALAEKGLAASHLERVILVGGTSLLPSLQERLRAEFRVPLDLTVDPLTVVARGAAVFAGTQRTAALAPAEATEGWHVQLEYEPVGSETDPLVGGKVVPPRGARLEGVTLEITEPRSGWRSGRIPIGPKGAFTVELLAERGRRCEYRILLADPKGTSLPVTPAHFPYTVGSAIANPPLPHHIGVATADNKPLWFFQKGQTLPARQRHTCRTTSALVRGPLAAESNVLRIPVIEGTNGSRADRNALIGPLQVLASDPRITRDVPTGSEIEVTIDVDVSRLTRVTAFVPLLDATFEGIFSPRIQTRSASELRKELSRESARLRELEVRVGADTEARTVADRIREQQLVPQMERLLAAADQDPDALAAADRKLLRLMSEVDELESRLEWPTQVAEAREALKQTSERLLMGGSADERQTYERLQGEVTAAIRDGRREVLRLKLDELNALDRAIVYRQPGFWLFQLNRLEQRRESMRSPAVARQLLQQAHRMVEAGDVDGLRSAVMQLHSLLPPQVQTDVSRGGAFGGTIMPE